MNTESDDSEVECEDEEKSTVTDNEESHNRKTESTGDSFVAHMSSNTVTLIIVGGVVGSLLGLAIIIAAIAMILVVWRLMIKKHQSEKDSEITNTNSGTPGYHNAVYDSKHETQQRIYTCVYNMGIVPL